MNGPLSHRLAPGLRVLGRRGARESARDVTAPLCAHALPQHRLLQDANSVGTRDM